MGDLAMDIPSPGRPCSHRPITHRFLSSYPSFRRTDDRLSTPQFINSTLLAQPQAAARPTLPIALPATKKTDRRGAPGETPYAQRRGRANVVAAGSPTPGVVDGGLEKTLEGVVKTALQAPSGAPRGDAVQHNGTPSKRFNEALGKSGV